MISLFIKFEQLIPQFKTLLVIFLRDTYRTSVQKANICDQTRKISTKLYKKFCFQRSRFHKINDLDDLSLA